MSDPSGLEGTDINKEAADLILAPLNWLSPRVADALHGSVEASVGVLADAGEPLGNYLRVAAGFADPNDVATQGGKDQVGKALVKPLVDHPIDATADAVAAPFIQSFIAIDETQQGLSARGTPEGDRALARGITRFALNAPNAALTVEGAVGLATGGAKLAGRLGSRASTAADLPTLPGDLASKLVDGPPASAGSASAAAPVAGNNVEAAGAGALASGPDTVSVFHASIKNGPEILATGLDPARGTAFVSRDIAAAQDALANHPDAVPGRGTIIESRLPSPIFDEHFAPFERSYRGFYPYRLKSTEIPVRNQAQFEAFNQNIVKIEER